MPIAWHRPLERDKARGCVVLKGAVFQANEAHRSAFPAPGTHGSVLGHTWLSQSGMCCWHIEAGVLPHILQQTGQPLSPPTTPTKNDPAPNVNRAEVDKLREPVPLRERSSSLQGGPGWAEEPARGPRWRERLTPLNASLSPARPGRRFAPSPRPRPQRHAFPGYPIPFGLLPPLCRGGLVGLLRGGLWIKHLDSAQNTEGRR